MIAYRNFGSQVCLHSALVLILFISVSLCKRSFGNCPSPGDWILKSMCYSPTTALNLTGVEGCIDPPGQSPCGFEVSSGGYCTGEPWEEPEAGQCRDKDPEGNDVQTVCRENAAQGMVEVEKFHLACGVLNGECQCGKSQFSPPRTTDVATCVCEDR